MSSYHLPTWFPWVFQNNEDAPWRREHRRNNAPRGSPERNLRWTPDMAGHVFRQRCWMTLAQVRPFVLGEPRRIGVTVSLLHHSGMWKCLTIQKGNTVRKAIIRTLHNPAAKEPSEKGSSSSSPHVSGASTSCKHCSLFVPKSGDQKEFATYLYLEFGSNNGAFTWCAK